MKGLDNYITGNYGEDQFPNNAEFEGLINRCMTGEEVREDESGEFYFFHKPSGTRYYPNCAFCMRERGQGSRFFPSHNASKNCESGGHDHCTCETCF